MGLLKKEIKTLYDKYGEKLGQEGRAREELILKALETGWIRIRLYKNKMWSINVYRWTRREQQKLANWADNIVAGKGDKYTPVDIVASQSNKKVSKKDLTVDDLTRRKHFESIIQRIDALLEGGLSRMAKHMQESSVGIMTAFRAELS